MRWGYALLVGGLLLLPAKWLHAQDVVLEQLYGNGVIAYFSGNDAKAHKYLTAAIQDGSRDPRCYYFRGLADLRLGREEDAEIDFKKGAELESRDVNSVYDVPRSLERIQGEVRLKIERYRMQARLAAMERAQRIRKARYNDIRDAERRILEQQATLPPQAPATPRPAPAKSFAPAAAPPPAMTPQSAPPGTMPPPAAPVTSGVASPNRSPVAPAQAAPPTGTPKSVAPTGTAPEKASPEGNRSFSPPEQATPGGSASPAALPAAGSAEPVNHRKMFQALGKSLGKAVGGDRKLPAPSGPPPSGKDILGKLFSPKTPAGQPPATQPAGNGQR